VGTTSETSENVTWHGDTSKIITSSPYIQHNLFQSLRHGSKTEQLLACFILYGQVSKALAKQAYGETRLTQRVSDLTVKGLFVGRYYSQNDNRGVPKATYYLPEQSIPAAQTRINELRLFRKAQPINWEVDA
jgi:hypothetical protein